MEQNQTGFNLDYEIMECGNCGCRAFTMTRWRDADSKVRGHVWNTNYNCLECGELSITNNKNLEGSHNKLERVSVNKNAVDELESFGQYLDAESTSVLNWPTMTKAVNRIAKLSATVQRMNKAILDRLTASLE